MTRLIGQSVIVAPTGEIVAMTSTMGDEVIVRVRSRSGARARKRIGGNTTANRDTTTSLSGPGRPLRRKLTARYRNPRAILLLGLQRHGARVRSSSRLRLASLVRRKHGCHDAHHHRRVRLTHNGREAGRTVLTAAGRLVQVTLAQRLVYHAQELDLTAGKADPHFVDRIHSSKVFRAIRRSATSNTSP